MQKLPNDDPREILSAIYADVRGRPDDELTQHPRFAGTAFRYYLPKIKLFDTLNNSKRNIVFNHDFFTPEMLYDVAAQNAAAHFIVASTREKLHPRECFFPWHLLQTARHNKQQAIAIPSSKNWLADALLGINKPHRINLFQQLRNSNIFASTLVSLSHPAGDAPTYRSAELDNLELDVLQYTTPGTTWDSMRSVSVPPEISQYSYPTCCPASQIIPSNVYANTWLSVVSETAPCGWFNEIWDTAHAMPNEFFPTEKIAKPLCAGRMFLVSAPRGYLAHLRKLGFETFGDVIDESYDNYTTADATNAAIVQELERLSKENMPALYKKLLPRLQHNQNLIYSETLYEPTRNFLENLSK